MAISAFLFANVSLKSEEASNVTQSAKKYALLIGNAHYKDEDYFPSLVHPEKDVRDVGEKLRDLDFDVTVETDKTSDEMRNLVDEFTKKSAGAAMALFYFSGHGVQVDNLNCLLGVNADGRLLTSPSEYPPLKYSINLDDPVANLRVNQSRIKVFVFDACREIVRAKGGPAGLGVTSSGAQGCLIAYAAAPGHSALDPPRGEHSVFTEQVLAHLEENLDIITIFSQAQDEVAKETNFGQLPWLSFSPGLFGVTFRKSPRPVQSASLTLSEAQEKGPEPLPLSNDDSPLLKEHAVKKFLEQHWEALASEDIDTYVSDLNDPVQWYQQGPTSIEYVRRGVKAAFKHWDSIERSISGPITIIPLSNGAGIAVTYPMTFDLANGKNHLKGSGTDTVEIRAIDGRLKIFAQDQQINSGQ